MVAIRAVDPDSIGFVDPDLESGSRRTKMTNKKKEKRKKFHVLKSLTISLEG